ncbi:hypothetical protein GQ53DRAFT_815142 [Thozetella sp. PMI_491]|nr:hypothetical protein GQ53DRAFT_815142 [Thozetella sp. PMI_491]
MPAEESSVSSSPSSASSSTPAKSFYIRAQRGSGSEKRATNSTSSDGEYLTLAAKPDGNYSVTFTENESKAQLFALSPDSTLQTTDGKLVAAVPYSDTEKVVDLEFVPAVTSSTARLGARQTFSVIITLVVCTLIPPFSLSCTIFQWPLGVFQVARGGGTALQLGDRNYGIPVALFAVPVGTLRPTTTTPPPTSSSNRSRSSSTLPISGTVPASSASEMSSDAGVSSIFIIGRPISNHNLTSLVFDRIALGICLALRRGFIIGDVTVLNGLPLLYLVFGGLFLGGPLLNGLALLHLFFSGLILEGLLLNGLALLHLVFNILILGGLVLSSFIIGRLISSHNLTSLVFDSIPRGIRLDLRSSFIIGDVTVFSGHVFRITFAPSRCFINERPV